MLLFALPVAWVSIKLTDWVVCRKRPGRINKVKKSTLCFLSGPIGNDSTRHADKKNVCIRFCGKTLIRLSTIKFTKHYNLTSTLDLVCGVRNQVLAVYVSHWVVCCFGGLQRSKRGDWFLDKFLNSFLRYVTFENQCLYNAMKFLRRLLPGLQRKCANNSLPRRTAVNLFRGKVQGVICFSRQIFTVRKISHRLEEPRRTCCIIRRYVYLFRCIRHLRSHFMLWHN